MSEEANTGLASQSSGKKWGDPIDEDRKQELRRRLRAWWGENDHGKRLGPFENEHLTGAEVFWLAVCSLSEQENITENEAEHQLLNFTPDNKAIRTVINLPEQDMSDTELIDLVELTYVDLSLLCLQGAILRNAQLAGSCLMGAQLCLANLMGAELQRAFLTGAQLQWARLRNAQLREAVLIGADLMFADLTKAQLQEADLTDAHLQGADLREAFLSEATDLHRTRLFSPDAGSSRVADVRWGGANLAALKEFPPLLADEQLARQVSASLRLDKFDHSDLALLKQLQFDKFQPYDELEKRIDLFRAAARANRQLAVALENQGMSEEASRFAYLAQGCQRAVYKLQGWKSLGRWLFSWFLWLIAGYGYRPLRSLIAYLVIIFGFMGLYLLNAHFVAPHLTWDEALVLSVSSFHGRGFFSENITLGDTYARLAALEAVFGLLIEISFIATFTQRFFGSK